MCITSSALSAAAAIAFWSSMIASNRDGAGDELATVDIIQAAELSAAAPPPGSSCATCRVAQRTVRRVVSSRDMWVMLGQLAC
jgi:hypothetical protein